MKTFWRLGYAFPSRFEFRSAGWRLLFWRVWWFSPREERRWLERTAAQWNVEVFDWETNLELRERIMVEVFGLGRKR